MRKQAPLILALVLLLGGCASGGGGPRAGRSDLITEEQLRGNSYSSLYEAVATLRPNWLRTRGPDSFATPTEIQVYVDNMKVGGIANLQQISPLSAYYLQRYDGIEASARWGLGHGAGVIYVSTTPMRER